MIVKRLPRASIFSCIQFDTSGEKMVTYISFSQGNSEYSKTLDKRLVGREHMYAFIVVFLLLFFADWADLKQLEALPAAIPIQARINNLNGSLSSRE